MLPKNRFSLMYAHKSTGCSSCGGAVSLEKKEKKEKTVEKRANVPQQTPAKYMRMCF